MPYKVRPDSDRGSQRHKAPLIIASEMAAACRKLAADLRAEWAAGWPNIKVTNAGRQVEEVITRQEAARRMDETAKRWEIEAAGGPPNEISRRRLGVWHG